MFSKLLATSTVALSLGRALAGVQFAGVNIAGFDFGCGNDGTCPQSGVFPPLLQYNGNQVDGVGQMNHFTNDDGMNLYRLPVAWQYLVNDNVGGPLDPTNFGKYDALVQACLATGSHCIVDIHNYARWNGQIIGQGGPSDDQFANVWGQLATKYASDSKVIMGIMNEPHDIPDMTKWANTVQAAVTAIRNAGANDQYILLPGNGWTSATGFATNSAPALSNVKNPDGSTANLIYDIHKYLDIDSSGTHTNCVSDQIDGAFAPLATYLRDNKRQALLSETGGGSSDPSCLNYFCAALDFLNQNADVYLGWTAWAAGAFSLTYELSLVPTNNGGSWTDQPLMKQCVAAKFSPNGATGKRQVRWNA